MNYLLYYFIFINFITFVLFGFDKYNSINNKRRIRNSTLLGLCLLGGSIGGICGMYLFRHKTQTWYYVYGIPFIIVIQIIIKHII